MYYFSFDLDSSYIWCLLLAMVDQASLWFYQVHINFYICLFLKYLNHFSACACLNVSIDGSDSIPLFGYRRRSYLILSGLLGAFSWCLMASFVDSKHGAALCIFLGSLSVAFSDVVSMIIYFKLLYVTYYIYFIFF